MPEPAATTPPVRGRRLLLGLLAVLVLLFVPAVAIPTLMCRQPDPKLEDFGTVPAFHLTDERGQPFDESALRGHVTLVSFLFTRCDTICPVTTAKMAALQDKTADVGDRVKLLSFSVDPSYDTPERLAAYARKFHADPERWRFVTGPNEVVQALVTGPFMTSMLREPDRPNGIPNIAHGGYFILVDPMLHIRGVYDSNDVPKLDTMVRDARYLARTMRTSAR